MAESLLKHHCYCQILLMRISKIAVCLQTKAISHHLIILAKFHQISFTNSSKWTLGIDFGLNNFDAYDHYAVCTPNRIME